MNRRKGPRPDLTGRTFGRLTVIRCAGKFNPRNGEYHWYVQCACGREPNMPIIGHSLTAGTTQSCGCLRRERAREQMKGINAPRRDFRTPSNLAVARDMRALGESYRSIGRTLGVSSTTVRTWLTQETDRDD